LLDAILGEQVYNEFSVVSFYEFAFLNEPVGVADGIKALCADRKLQGSVILATEGINGTVAGHPDNIDIFVDYLKVSNFPNLNCKFARTDTMPFYRMKVRIKPEIITMLDAAVDPRGERGTLIDAGHWNDFISQGDVILLDVRNFYETDIGTFEGALKPGTASFGQFKEYIDDQLIDCKDKKIAMFCTGGIRCEKASYYMKAIGFLQVFQLEGGILKYLETVPEQNSKWEGECFVFDNRVAVTHQLEKGEYELCHGCRMPISPGDLMTAEYEEGVSCPNCFYDSSVEKKHGARERSRQIQRAKRLGYESTFVPGSLEDYT
jgi:UPF0176 protein